MLLHISPPTRVSFADRKETPSCDEWLASFPDTAISALIRNVDPTDELEGPELVEELARTYGGQMLANDVRAKKVRTGQTNQPEIEHGHRISDLYEAEAITKPNPPHRLLLLPWRRKAGLPNAAMRLLAWPRPLRPGRRLTTLTIPARS